VGAVAGSGFVLDTAAATKAVRAYDECSSSAQRTLQDMLADVDALRATRYSGRQAKALDQAVDGLDADLRKLVALLADLSGVVGDTSVGYTNTDADVAQSINAVGNVYNRLSG
jgi:WXG100 family type VII secretion target